MKVVLDTSALIYLTDFSHFEHMLTVPEVVPEVRDRLSLIKLAGLKLEVCEPDEQAVRAIRRVAGQTGDLASLSQTDVKVLALAQQTGHILITDDRAVQNVARQAGISYLSLTSRPIHKLIVWKWVCPACGRLVKHKACPVCGTRPVRRPARCQSVRKPA